MGYEIDTSNGVDLIFKINHIFKLKDNLENRKKVHEVRELIEKLNRDAVYTTDEGVNKNG